MTRFGADFYQRFYVNAHTRVTTRAEMERRAGLVAALVKQLEIPVHRILDAGCGLGWMRGELARAFPKASYVGLEVSEHLCNRYGWVQGSLVTFQPRGRFDIIICYDVMQYLSDTAAARALSNIGRLCRGALYFHAPTSEDWRRNADRTCSDAQIRLRATQWYRARLARNFRHVGCGIHVRRGVPVMQWELEKSD